MWESLAQGQHKPSDCSLQINIPDNSTLEAKLPQKKKKVNFPCLREQLRGSLQAGSRTQTEPERSCFGSEAWGGGGEKASGIIQEDNLFIVATQLN